MSLAGTLVPEDAKPSTAPLEPQPTAALHRNAPFLPQTQHSGVRRTQAIAGCLTKATAIAQKLTQFLAPGDRDRVAAT